MTDESALWKRFIGGDEEAYALIYKRYVSSLYSYGLCFTGNKCLVEDCIHDLFVKLYQNRLHLNESVHIKLYLFTALKHHLFNAFRKELPHDAIEEGSSPAFSIEYSVEESLIAREEDVSKKARVLSMLSMLTPVQKEVIYYRFELELSYDEIAELMNMKPQSAQNLMQRALKKLRENVSPEEFFLLLMLFAR
jgi:RNA polymerase sigma factor (sigma-70 family)